MLRSGLGDLAGLDAVAVWWSVMVDTAPEPMRVLVELRDGGESHR